MVRGLVVACLCVGGVVAAIDGRPNLAAVILSLATLMALWQ